MQALHSFGDEVRGIIKSEEVSCEALAKQDFFQMYYVYILQSKVDKSFYTGFTEDLKQRIRNHNAVGQNYSSKKAPLRLSWYCVFKNKQKALQFEKYLKSGSGFAFARKRLVS